MAIIRSKNRRFFSAVDSAVIRNGMLSLPALGLLVTLLDHSDHCVFFPSEIARSCGLTDEALQPLFRELLKSGFLTPRRDRGYDLYELPLRCMQLAEQQTPPASGQTAAPGPEPPRVPMSDERIAYWLGEIRRRFPLRGSQAAGP